MDFDPERKQSGRTAELVEVEVEVEVEIRADGCLDLEAVIFLTLRLLLSLRISTYSTLSRWKSSFLDTTLVEFSSNASDCGIILHNPQISLLVSTSYP